MDHIKQEKSFADLYEEYLSKDESEFDSRISFLKRIQRSLVDSGETQIAFEIVGRELEKIGNQCSSELGFVYNSMIRISCQSGEFSKALEYAASAISVFDELGDDSRLPMIYNNIAGVYLKMGEFETSLEYIDKAIDLSQRNNDNHSLAKYLNNKGIAVENIKGDGSGAVFIEKAIELKEENSLKSDLPNSYMNLADIYTYTGKEDEAHSLLKRAREVANEIEDEFSLAEVCRYEANYYRAVGELGSALESLNTSLEYHKSKGNKSEILQRLTVISEIQEIVGDVKGALETHREISKLNAEIFKEEEARMVAKLQSSFSTMQKLKEIESMARRNRQLDEANRLIVQKNEELLEMQSQLSSANQLLKERAETDSLTGLMNQRKMFEIVEYEINRAKRYGNRLSIIMLDIDDFKVINDTFGHQKGDGILESLSSLIISSIRKIDYAFRYGGEEFVILLPSTGVEGAFSTAQRISESLKRTNEIPVTISIGVAEWSDESVNDLLLEVDTLMYEAKNTGKNRIVSR